MDQLLHKTLDWNVNSASEIKILLNQKPQEIDAQGTDRIYKLKKTEENVRVRILQSILHSL